MGITEELMSRYQVGLGDEVFITGLFKHHYGESRNIPIVRTGNIASLTEEKVSTKKFGAIDAYLIEARSIGGLSGSPVFLHLGVTRMFDGKVKIIENELPIFLFGLVHGHFDVSETAIDFVVEDKNPEGRRDNVNTGMAIIVPFHKIIEVMEAYETSGINLREGE